jgi:dTDP-4-amino-4,6-dideoxygalactose transaminase
LEGLIPYLERIDASNIYSNYGPLVDEFEDRLCSYFGVKRDQLCTSVNATQALEGAIRTSGSSPKSIWELPSWTFTATAAALYASGSQGYFSDIDENWRVVPTEKFKYLIDVLPFGDSLNLERLPSSIDTILVDAAASFDALQSVNLSANTRIGVVVSFHATKTLSTGEGAVFFSNDTEWVRNFKAWTNFGFHGTRHSSSVGTNAKMNEYAAALGLASLDSWDQSRLKWKKVMKMAVDAAIRNGFEVQPALKKNLVSPYWIIQGKNPKQIESVRLRLNSSGIDTRYWWEKGCAEMKAYRGVNSGSLIQTKLLSELYLGLPLSTHMTEEDFDRVEFQLISSKET